VSILIPDRAGQQQEIADLATPAIFQEHEEEEGEPETPEDQVAPGKNEVNRQTGEPMDEEENQDAAEDLAISATNV